ncbi:MAG TPA: type II toxin-antitoxin system VapC family toxin [Candidatus Dormibacteraeota bacterium]|jgi:predicted nucleic acid-binding protein|nr:type II toxin-antitoxin system VapC family toxin [Candidatus Dormibacteraeota bacterium]
MRTWRASSLVVDASAIVELLRRTTAGRQVARRLQGAALAAPAHLDAEVLSALARLARDNPADEPLVGPRLALLARAPIQRYPCPPLLIEAWEMRANVAVRDALYVALSRRLGAPLLTADHRLARSTAGMAGVVVQTV